MALHQHSCWRSVKPPCQRGTHTNLPKSLMEPVKTTGPYTGSIIDFILALLLRTHHAMHTNGGPFRGPTDRRVKLAPECHSFCCGNESWKSKALEAFFGTSARKHTQSHVHTQPHMHFARLTSEIWCAARKLISENCRFNQLGIFLCNQMNAMKILWAPMLYCKWCRTQQRYKHWFHAWVICELCVWTCIHCMLVHAGNM